MNKHLKTILFILLCLSGLLTSCKKEETQSVKVTTDPVSQISRTSGWCKGSMINESTDTVIAYGFCWSTETMPTYADERELPYSAKNGIFEVGIDGLSPGTLYYVRAYAFTAENKYYGNQESFTTKPATAQTTFNPALTYQTVSDIDGNSYKSIKIGDQEWIAENLKTTRLNDGAEIPLITDNILWRNIKSPAYSWYNNDEAGFKNIYGGYYNWYAVNSGKLCPSGWHVPDESDWKALKVFLGMTPDQADGGYFTDNKVGTKMKETGTINWIEESIISTNESGFTALPGGTRSDGTGTEIFGGEGNGAGWWSASLVFPTHGYAFSHFVNSQKESIFKSDMLNSAYGLNVRCVRD